MREYVDQLTQQDRVVVVEPHRPRPQPTPAPRRKRGAGLGVLALIALLSLPLLGSATLVPVRSPDVTWNETGSSRVLPCHQPDAEATSRPTAPTLWVEPTPRTLRAVPALDGDLTG